MSRNFDLLRRAGKGQALFVQRTGYSSRTDEARVYVSGKTAQNEAVKAEENEALGAARELSGIAKEELIKLVRRVFVFPNSKAPRSVSFSSVEGSGSSEICFHVGDALAAQESGSVCLVDANFRTPSLHRFLGVDRSPGLLDAILQAGPIKDYAVRIGHGNLWLVAPGSPAPEVRNLFPLDRLNSRITELKEQFQFVLVDAPPIFSHTDAVLLGQMTDGFVIVLEANSTRRETALIAKQNLESAKVRILGAILNNRTFPIPEALYRRL